MSENRTPPVTRRRVRELGAHLFSDEQEVPKDAPSPPQNPQLIEAHFSPEHEQLLCSLNQQNDQSQSVYRTLQQQLEVPGRNLHQNRNDSHFTPLPGSAHSNAEQNTISREAEHVEQSFTNDQEHEESIVQRAREEQRTQSPTHASDQSAEAAALSQRLADSNRAATSVSTVNTAQQLENDVIQHSQGAGASARNAIPIISPSSLPALSSEQAAMEAVVAARSAASRADLAMIAEENTRRLENEMVMLRESVSAIKDSVRLSQNETNRLISTLIGAQRAQNFSTLQRTQQRSPRNSQQISPHLSNSARPPSPSPRARESKAKPRAPDDFNGEPEDNAQMWLRQVQTYLELTNEEPMRWAKIASSYLRKEASIWWEGYLDSVQRSVLSCTWAEFAELFLQRFRSVASEEHAISKLQRWKQTGTLESYIRGFANLSANIPYQLMPESMRLLMFVNGLKPHILRYVKQSKPRTVQDAIAEAREGADTFAPDRAAMQPIRHFNNRKPAHGPGDSRALPIQLDNTEVGENFDSYPEENDQEIESTEQEGSVLESYNMLLAALPPNLRQLYKEGRCFHCKKKGHNRDKCMKLKSDLAANPSLAALERLKE